MLASAFVKTSQIYKSHSKAIQTQTDPEKGVRNDGDNDKIDEPESGSGKIGDPKEGTVDVVDFDVGICWLKDPVLLIGSLIKLDPPPESCKLFTMNVFIDPEIDRNEEEDKNEIQEFKIREEEIPFSIRVKNYKVMTSALPSNKMPICL